MKLIDRIKSGKIPRGLYHYRATGKWSGLRLQLRIEEDSSGVLIINSSRVLFLNRSATEYVYLFMKGIPEERVVREMVKKYKLDDETALNDLRDVLFIVNTFAKTSDVCPVSYLGVEKIEPFTKKMSAPYRMDLAITYRCNNQCLHCYTGGPLETEELPTEKWFDIIDKLFEIGIPHVTFTGGEPTLRDDLPQLIKYAEDRGLVTGIVTNGRLLSDQTYLDRLIDAGVDHIQITLESHRESVHDTMTCVKGSWSETVKGLRNAIATPVYTLTNTTLTKHNSDDIIETVNFLHKLGLEHFACNSIIYAGRASKIGEEICIEESELKPLLIKIRDYARTLGMEFMWYTPTQYCFLNPLQLDLGIKHCSACTYNMCVEPSGEVIPCQSYFKRLGNILVEPWSKIWNHPTCKDIRSRKYAPDKCQECQQMTICGGGCPLKLDHDVQI